VALLVQPTSQSAAHTGDFYPWWYPIGIDDVPVYFDDDFPSGSARNRVIDGMKQWNRVGRRMYYLGHRSASISSNADEPKLNRYQTHCPTPDVGGRRVGMIHWGPIDGPGGFVGATGWCWKTGELGGRHIKSFRAYFDRTEDWYTGTGNSTTRNRLTGVYEDHLDMWSVATHELGHGTGWLGHWNKSTPFCSYSTSASRTRTMCPKIKQGYERLRTLTGGDEHVFRSAYGSR
jgi:hypothetical protein